MPFPKVTHLQKSASTHRVTLKQGLQAPAGVGWQVKSGVDLHAVLCCISQPLSVPAVYTVSVTVLLNITMPAFSMGFGKSAADEVAAAELCKHAVHSAMSLPQSGSWNQNVV